MPHMIARLTALAATLGLGACTLATDAGLGKDPSAATTADMSVAAQGDLPCEVDQLLKTYCASCHGSPPTGAPIPLVTRADLVATSGFGGTQASRALARMKDANRPMPPQGSPAPSAGAIAAFETWVNAGAPAGSCVVDGGAGADLAMGAGPDMAGDVCTSNVVWMGGEQDWMGYPKDSMHPGNTCVSCHLADGGPALWIGGTVYPTLHEPLECLGVDGTKTPITVEITDAAKQVITLTPNASGNFYLRKGAMPATVTFPISARVIAGGKTRAMGQTVMTGDCNSCHTTRGTNYAPGRIMLP